jgi:hypothetical protein
VAILGAVTIVVLFVREAPHTFTERTLSIMAQQQQQQPGGRGKPTRLLTSALPDATVHQSPGAMATLGWIGVGAGIFANLWQAYTTISATFQMFTGSATPHLDLRDITFDICLLIAFSFQFALLFLVFRIDTRWKRQQAVGGALGRKKINRGVSGYGHAAIEVVQQLGLFAVWVGLAFVIDTLGDYTFISGRTISADPVTSAFLIFLYAVALYALSTLAFVRSIEYCWAASAVKEVWEAAREQRKQSQPKP